MFPWEKLVPPNVFVEFSKNTNISISYKFVTKQKAAEKEMSNANSEIPPGEAETTKDVIDFSDEKIEGKEEIANNRAKVKNRGRTF
jgi:hypothetical protein